MAVKKRPANRKASSSKMEPVNTRKPASLVLNDKAVYIFHQRATGNKRGVVTPSNLGVSVTKLLWK
jgi:hypothetical protein